MLVPGCRRKVGGKGAHGNRKGDVFKCQFCGHTAESDHSAALEILRRENDPDISLSTPKDQVKLLLLTRFRRRLEKWDFSFALSQVSWEPVRKEFGSNGVDAILSKLGADQGKISFTVAGKTPDTSCTTSGNHGGRAYCPKTGSQSESETQPHL
jgi:hypothetical protein